MTKHTPNPLPTSLDQQRRTTRLSGGVGRGICKAFAQAGIDRIIIIGRTLSTLTTVKNELESELPKVEVIVNAASVTDSAAMHSIIRATGKIDIVVSAAAICHQVTPPSTIATSELSEILQTNTVGPFLVISAILHERAIQGWEHEVKVVYVSSTLSHTHICHLSAYAASKAAMNLLCLHLNMEWNARGFSIFAISSRFDLYSIDWESVPQGLAHLGRCKLVSGILCVVVPELLAKKDWIEKNPWHLEIGLSLPSTERPTEDFFVVDNRTKN